jgi:hypothetical protein
VLGDGFADIRSTETRWPNSLRQPPLRERKNRLGLGRPSTWTEIDTGVTCVTVAEWRLAPTLG